MRSNIFSALSLGPTAITSFPHTAAVHTMIPKTSFDSQSDFDADWDYLYPWGSDHNGGARMAKSKHHPASGEKPASSGGKSIPIRYLSGTVHAKEQFNVSRSGGYDFGAEFKAATTKGTWPVFWLTAVDGWLPEAEWKGNGKVGFNTFDTSKEVKARNTKYDSPGDWHRFKTEVRDENGRDLAVEFFMDRMEVVRQVGRGF
ncbi:glycoside hydrolase family 16 protein [Acephala macrosclerotiorum]|nr:glycoside hydrolase family 16 protein [Acephala macrosclerotiorum]